MERQKKNQTGITLIALVISIIVMLILAGVSLNATVGENGIVTMAQKARETSQKTSELEALQMALVEYSTKAFTTEEDALDDMVNGLFKQELINWVDGTKDGSGSYIDYNQYDDEKNNRYLWVKKGDNSYRIYINDDETYSADEMPSVGGGTLKGGTYMVTKDAFASGEGVSDPNEKGKFTIEGNTKVVFNEPLGVKDDGITASGEMLSIYVKSGSNVKIYFNDNEEKRASDGKTHYLLSNKGLTRAAVDIERGGVLDIFVSANAVVEVDSGLGSAADQNNNPGTGGFAGIHVPGASSDTNGDGKITYLDIENNSGIYNCATLILSGAGELKCYGGKAGDGILFVGSGGAGGGGAGAGIGGNGGDGGAGRNGRSGDGKDGENCGIVKILSADLVVEAFGGGAGDGADGDGTYASSGGGYPAAGIGGGGAGSGGGSCCSGGGGFNGGAAEDEPPYWPEGMYSSDWASGVCEGNHNGVATQRITFYPYAYWAEMGSSYYGSSLTPYSSSFYPCSLPSDYNEKLWLGGFGGCGSTISHRAGQGGTAGCGGIIIAEKADNIKAYNGCRLTYGAYDSKAKENEALIYAQQGIGVATCDWEDFTYNNISTVRAIVLNDQRSITKTNYINPTMKNTTITFNSNIDFLKDANMAKQGVGSGAGYIEIDNGTFNGTYSEN